jgi:Flp pilus assembly protein CpaB
MQDLSLVGRRLKLRAVDGISPIQRVEVALVGTDAWFPIDSVDGVLDETIESIDTDISAIVPPGKYLVAVRIYDSAGNFSVRSIAAQ